MCNWRSDVDNSTKTNITKNLERKIEKLTTEEKDKKELKECMWEIMKNNGYQKKHKETKQIASKGKQKEERNDERRWYGLTSILRNLGSYWLVTVITVRKPVTGVTRDDDHMSSLN